MFSVETFVFNLFVLLFNITLMWCKDEMIDDAHFPTEIIDTVHRLWEYALYK